MGFRPESSRVLPKWTAISAIANTYAVERLIRGSCFGIVVFMVPYYSEV